MIVATVIGAPIMVSMPIMMPVPITGTVPIMAMAPIMRSIIMGRFDEGSGGWGCQGPHNWRPGKHARRWCRIPGIGEDPAKGRQCRNGRYSQKLHSFPPSGQGFWVDKIAALACTIWAVAVDNDVSLLTRGRADLTRWAPPSDCPNPAGKCRARDYIEVMRRSPPPVRFRGLGACRATARLKTPLVEQAKS
jgi:hypothetical protein